MLRSNKQTYFDSGSNQTIDRMIRNNRIDIWYQIQLQNLNKQLSLSIFINTYSACIHCFLNDEVDNTSRLVLITVLSSQELLMLIQCSLPLNQLFYQKQPLNLCNYHFIFDFGCCDVNKRCSLINNGQQNTFLTSLYYETA